jgi:hypothetical protein
VRVNPVSNVEPCCASQAPDELPSSGLRHPPTGLGDEDRTVAALPDVGVERSHSRAGEHRHGTLAALASQPEHPMPSLDVEVLDVSAQGLVDAQAVKRQQRYERRRAQAVISGDFEHGSQLCAVKARRG